jgi:enoyl-CoA hydratase/carnithine racemase
MITCEDRNSIAVIQLEHGKVNAIDLEFCDILEERLDEIEKSSQKAVVVTAQGKTFSAGVDLIRLLDGGKDYVREFVPKMIHMMRRLFLFPKPIVAALNGNAIAGGCVIACACDYKIAITGEGKIGVPEGLVGVPFPPLAFEIVRFAADHRYLQEIVYIGRYYGMDEGVERGLLDETVSAEMLMRRACEVATKMTEVPAETFGLIKRQLREPYLANVERSQETTAEILKVWSSEEAHAAIRSYLRRTIGK